MKRIICEICGRIIFEQQDGKTSLFTKKDVCFFCSAPKGLLEEIHKQAVEFRNKKRNEAFDGKLPENQRWVFEKMQEMFKNE